jgi:hypothetical protein
MTEFLILVRAMREAQENYKTTGLTEYQVSARALEKQVDSYLASQGYPVESLPF